MGRLDRVEETLPDKPMPPTDREPTMAEVMLMFAKLQREGQEQIATLMRGQQDVAREQLKQTRVKSNGSAPGISPFNPRGEKDYPLPELKCEAWLPHKITSAALGGLTREEVELFNLLEPGEYTIRMVDQQPQIILAVGEKNTVNGKLDKLSIMGPKGRDGHPTGLFTRDSRHRFPGLAVIMRMMINGVDEDGTVRPGPADVVRTMAVERKQVRDGELAVSVGE